VVLAAVTVAVWAAASAGATSAASGKAAAAKFDWRQDAGQQIQIGFSAHPLSDATISLIPKFEKLTGIKVKYQVAPEADFRAKLNTQLAAGSSAFDVYMTGPATDWQYIHNSWIEPLDKYVNNPKLTSSAWDRKDFFPAAWNVNRWTGVAFKGQGQGPVYAVPVNEEGYALFYRKDVLKAAGVAVPQTINQLIAAAQKLNGYSIGGKKLSGFVGRGIDNFGPLITGYGTFLDAYGFSDLRPDGTSGIDTQPVIDATEKWATLMKTAPADVASYDWQQALSYFAAGNAVFFIDADHMAGSFEDKKQSQVVGKVGYALPPAGPKGRGSGLWLWSFGMNSHSKHKDAAWLFIQWATSKQVMTKAVTFGNINPTRKSVAHSKTMLNYVKNWGDYNTVWSTILAKYAKWRFQPAVDFPQVGQIWAEAVQQVFQGNTSAKDALGAAAPKINAILARDRK
jgi:multiple sugar transport system substrate-binding protein